MANELWWEILSEFLRENSILVTVLIALLLGAPVLRTIVRKRQVPKRQSTHLDGHTDHVSVQPRKPAISAASNTATTESSENIATSITSTISKQDLEGPMDVWEQRRQRGILPASMNHKGASADKPFGSSYYYAHNDPRTKGGYSDGLRMEDYTMNGPRLLSKGGIPVGRETSVETIDKKVQQDNDTRPATITDTTAATHTNNTDNGHATTIHPVRTIPARRVVDVVSYLWDDDGGKTGTIVLETLPGGCSTEAPLSWKAAQVASVSACLVGAAPLSSLPPNSSTSRTIPSQGLLVQISTPSLDWDYQLHIPHLYDAVQEVTHKQTAKRCRIKLVKQSSSWLLRPSYKMWPHPHKSKTK